MKSKVLAIAGTACLLAGCVFDLPDAPPHRATNAPVPFVRSTIGMPISVDVTEIRNRLLADLKSRPIVDGQTPELGIRLLAEEKSIFQEPQKVIDVPYKAAACYVEKIPTQVTRHVKVGVETFSCLINPLKWGDCTRDVFKDITETLWKDVTKCVPEQLEVAHTVLTAVERLVPKNFDTTAIVHYRADVRSVSVEVEGRRMKVSVDVNAPVSVDIKQNLLVGNVTAKGALSCSSDVSGSAQATFALAAQNDGDIGIDADVTSVDLDIKKFCVPGAVEVVQAWSFSGPEQLAISQALKNAVRMALLDSAKAAVAKQASQVAIGAEMSRAVGQLRGAQSLGNGISLVVLPQRVVLSQIEGVTSGGKQVLKTSAAVDADLEVIYGAPGNIPPQTAPVPVSLGTVAPNFTLVPRGNVPFDRMSKVLLEEANRAVAAPLKDAGFVLGEVEVYQNAEQIVFGVEIKSTSWWRPSGRIFLSGQPQYDPAKGTILFRNFDFTVETSDWLLRHALGAVRPLAQLVIGPKMVFPVDDQLARATKQFATFTIPINSGSVTGKLSGTTSAPRLRNVWVDGNALRFDVELKGEARLEVAI